MSNMPLVPRGWILGLIAQPATLLVMCGANLCSQSVEIKLVDGRNGRPMVGSASYVNVWVGPERKQAIAIPTDSNGVARLRLTLNTVDANVQKSPGNGGSIVVDHPIVNYDESLRINAPFALCTHGGSHYSWLQSQPFSTKQVLQQGYVSPNTCGKATASSKPGQVILFVRPLSWWEKVKQ